MKSGRLAFPIFTFSVFLLMLSCISLHAQVSDVMTDPRDRQTYRTIVVGEQVWMAENLSFLTAVGSFCYDNKIENCAKYGRMYNWNAAKMACPLGWRLPSKPDFEHLFREIAPDGSDTYEALTENGSTGFDALHGGWRGTHGSYNHIGIIGYWWTNTAHTIENAWFMGMSRFGPEAYLTYGQRRWGLSVRCIKKND